MSLDPLPEVKPTKGQTRWALFASVIIFLWSTLFAGPIFIFLLSSLTPKAGEAIYRFYSFHLPWLPSLPYTIIGLLVSILFYRTYSKSLSRSSKSTR
jgi:hypothetical protein